MEKSIGSSILHGYLRSISQGIEGFSVFDAAVVQHGLLHEYGKKVQYRFSDATIP